MEKLELASILQEDFQTVRLVFESDSTTGRLDALILAWTKYEKQLRKLFSFLVYRQGFVTNSNIKQFEKAIIANRNLDYRTLPNLIERLCNISLIKLLGSEYDQQFEKNWKSRRTAQQTPARADYRGRSWCRQSAE